MKILTEQQLRFFDAFGYLVLPGLLARELEWITAEFEAVFQDRGIVHDASRRSVVVPFIDQREKLCTIIDLPQIEGALADILGDDFNYFGSDGNYYTGDTRWHPDGNHTEGLWVKMALYLDPVARDTGCLRVIPGTHRIEALETNWQARQAGNCDELWGIAGREVPSIALESQPGDVVIFNQNLLHASYGGNTRRRMLALSFTSHLASEAALEVLKTIIGMHARFWTDSMYTDITRHTGPASRQIHLKQVAENEGHLPALSAKARAEMAEPAHG